MKTKKCFKCGKRKRVSGFYPHPAMSDGYLGKCKDCTKADVKDHREKNIDRIRAYDRARGNRQTLEYRRRYRETNPIKTGARTMVGNYVRDGKLKKPRRCSECKRQTRLDGHHDDYAKPLEVRWLCSACHHQWHGINGEAKNG